MSASTPQTPPTPMGGAAPLSTASPPAASSSAAAAAAPEFDIPYDFVTELPLTDSQRKWRAFVDKNKQNPFIAIGCVATVGALIGAFRSMRAGNPRQMQMFFRLRVGAQAFAIVAIVAGGVMYEGAHPIKSLLNIPENAKRGWEFNAKKAELEQKAGQQLLSMNAAERAAASPPTLTPKRSFQDHSTDVAAADAAGGEDDAQKAAEDRMRTAMKLKEEDALASREDRRNKFKLN